jgi:ABC-2 type transport system permease protein
MKRYFNGTLKLSGFIAKREIVTTAIWFGILIFMTSAVAIMFGGMFGTPEEAAGMELMMRNPAMIAMLGPLYPLEGQVTAGGIFVNGMLLFTILAVCVMNIFLVVRNTRADEEKGRAEVIRSLPVGRLSNLAATMLVAAVVNAALALTVGFGLGIATLGIQSMGFGGAILYGAALGVSGLLFAGIAAVCAQLSQNSLGSIGISLAALGFFYILRAPADMSEAAGGSGASAMLSPFGMIMRTKIYAGNVVYPVFAVLGIALAFAALAFWLNSIRDLDQGLIPARKGKSEASWLLKYPEGLAFRLLRGPLAVWAGVMLLLGIAYGAVLGDVSTFIEGNEMLEALFGGAEAGTEYMTKGFVSTILSLMAIMASVPVASAVLKPFAEEKAGRAESILSKAVSRQRVLTGYIVIAAAASFVMLSALAAGLAMAASAVMDNPLTFGQLFSAAIIYLPAAWVIIGIAALAGGALPQKAAAVTYGVLGYSVAASYLGPIILPDATWLKYLTPFGYVPKLITETAGATEYLLLGAITLAAIGAAVGGYFLYRKRDLV